MILLSKGVVDWQGAMFLLSKEGGVHWHGGSIEPCYLFTCARAPWTIKCVCLTGHSPSYVCKTQNTHTHTHTR